MLGSPQLPALRAGAAAALAPAEAARSICCRGAPALVPLLSGAGVVASDGWLRPAAPTDPQTSAYGNAGVYWCGRLSMQGMINHSRNSDSAKRCDRVTARTAQRAVHEAL